MWVAKLKMRHNCIIGNRCRRFGCTSSGYPLDSYSEKGFQYFLHFEKISGDSAGIQSFIADIKKDKNITYLEANNNLIFFTYKTKEKGVMPSNTFLKKVFYVNPVIVGSDGFESWEVASFSRETINEFIVQIQKTTKQLEHFKVEHIRKTSLKNIHFPAVAPLLSKGQQEALALAVHEGYYAFPRKIELRKLAKIAGVSFSTFREHLRRAEQKTLTAQ